MTQTPNQTETHTTSEETINCVICKEEHPRRQSVKVISTGLAAGLDCLTPELRELFGLPSADEAAQRMNPYAPTMLARTSQPHELFMIMSDDVRKKDHDQESFVEDRHFFQVIDQVGLKKLPEFNYNNPCGRHKLTIDDREVDFEIRTYTSPPGMFQVWMEALVHEPETEIVSLARLSWSDFSYPEANAAHDEMVKAIEESERTAQHSH